MGKTILPDTAYTLLRALDDRLGGVERMLISPFGQHLFTELPTGPVDGQVIVYAADATNGVMWILRYNELSSSAYKWEFVGGPPLAATDVSTDQSTASTSYVGLATAGPSITVPLAGDYDVSIGSGSYFVGTAGNLYHSFAVGATGAIDADSIQFNGTAATLASGARTSRKTGLAAADALVSKHRVASGATTGHWFNRWMRATPTRVG